MRYARDGALLTTPTRTSGDATCPTCDGDVMPVRGTKVEWHWRHYHDAQCAYSAHESEGDWHWGTKAWFQRRGCSLEVTDGDRRRNVGLGHRFIELQASPITVRDIDRRDSQNTLWITPFGDPVHNVLEYAYRAVKGRYQQDPRIYTRPEVVSNLPSALHWLRYGGKVVEGRRWVPDHDARCDVCRRELWASERGQTVHPGCAA